MEETHTSPSIATDTAEYAEAMYKAVKGFFGRSEDGRKKQVTNVDFKMPLNVIVHGSWLR